jgi:competence protein ComEC
MWFTFGFVLACGLCAYLLPANWILPAVTGVLLVQAAALAAMQKWKNFLKAAMLCFGCAVGLCWFLLFSGKYLAVPVSMDGTKAQLTVTATDYSYETDYGIAVDAAVVLEEKSYQVRVYLDKMEPLAPGDQVTALFRCRATTSESSEGSTYHPGKGIFLLLYQQSDVIRTRAEELPKLAFAADLRLKIKTILRNNLPEDTFAFGKALLLGDTTDLSYETDTDFKLSGIRHVVAVSGLHISILFALISAVTFRKRFLTLLLGVPVLGIFAAVAGFTPSVVRACIMSCLMLLGSALDKEYDGPTALSFAILVMLAANPLAVTSVSLQLSVSSVAGILLFRERIHNWMIGFFGDLKKSKWKKRAASWLCSSVSVSVSAMILTTPLCAVYFGTVSLISVLTNLLSLWIISFIFYGLMAVCILSLFWNGASVFFGRVTAVLIRYVLSVAGIMADVPLAAIYTESLYVVLWLIFVYVLLSVFLLQEKKQPRILICCAAIGLCLCLLLSWAEPMTDDVRLTVLDVGQGQSILLQTEGRAFLIDCGGDQEDETADLIAGTLLSQGIDRLDGIILTHYDYDHAGALDNLLTRVQTDLLLVADTEGAKPFPQVEGKVCYVNETMEIALGESKMTVFGPIYSGSSNENSLCILFESENCDILITGDRSDFGERMLMRNAQLPDVDLLIAGHHGSKHSTSEELLRTVRPETVIISAGEGNRYGHPHEELLQRLTQFGCTVYRTDLHGTIIYRR